MASASKFGAWEGSFSRALSKHSIALLTLPIAMHKLPKFVERRNSDLDKYWADPRKAHKELKWIAEKNLGDMVTDLIRFVKKQKYT